MNTTNIRKINYYIFPLFILFGVLLSSFKLNENKTVKSQQEVKAHSIKLLYKLTSVNADKLTNYVKNLKGIVTCQPNFTKNTIDVTMDARFRGSEIDAIVEKYEHDLFEKH